MSCREIEPLLSEALDGLLPERESNEVIHHLASCAGCRREMEELRAVREAAARLPRGVEPSRDLWPQVAARIAAQRRTAEPVRPFRRLSRRALLAAAALIVVTAPAGLWLRSRQAVPGPDSETVVLATLRSRAPHLSPETLKVVEENLHLIDGAISEIEEVLKKEPDNPQIQLLLAQQHRRRAEVLGALEKTAAYL